MVGGGKAARLVCLKACAEDSCVMSRSKSRPLVPNLQMKLTLGWKH